MLIIIENISIKIEKNIAKELALNTEIRKAVYTIFDKYIINKLYFESDLFLHIKLKKFVNTMRT